jgi:hypothetical protein
MVLGALVDAPQRLGPGEAHAEGVAHLASPFVVQDELAHDVPRFIRRRHRLCR